VLNEPDSKEARNAVTDFLKKGYTLCTVDVALVECLNVIWKHTNLLKDLTPEEASLAVEDLTKLYDGFTIITTRELKDEAMHIAISQNLTVYDALFIAAAQKMNATLYTADKKLCAKTDKPIKSKLLTKETQE
jgi:predicted nucleic acid-binding protein